jgi:hypothetical protein
MQGFGEGRWLLAVSADLLAGIGRAAQMKMPREPGHVHGRLLPNHPRHGHLPRVAPRQLLQGGLAQPGDRQAFGQQPPGFLFPVRAPFRACPVAAMARLLEHRRAHLEHPFRKCLAAPIPAPAQIAPPAIRLRPRCGDSAAVPRLGARPVVEPLHPAPPSGGSKNSHRQRGLAGIAFLEAISTRTPHFSTKGATASQPRVEEVEGTCEGRWGAGTRSGKARKNAPALKGRPKVGRTSLSRPFRARSLWMSFLGRCPGLAWVMPLASKRGVRVLAKTQRSQRFPGAEFSTHRTVNSPLSPRRPPRLCVSALKIPHPLPGRA